MSWAGAYTASQRRNVSGLWQSETVRLPYSPKETLGGEKKSYTQQQPPSYLQFLPVSKSALQLVPRSPSHGRREGGEHLLPTRTLPATPHTPPTTRKLSPTVGNCFSRREENGSGANSQGQECQRVQTKNMMAGRDLQAPGISSHPQDLRLWLLPPTPASISRMAL